MENTNVNFEEKESSAIRASEKGSCTEALAGATEQDPAEQGSKTPLTGEEHSSFCSHTTESLEGLTEKVGTLGLQVIKKNRCGAARKRVRKAKSADAPTGATDGGRPQSAAGRQPLDSQDPGTSRTVTCGISAEVPGEWRAPTWSRQTTAAGWGHSGGRAG
jgi:hypothetical protein